MTQNSLRSLVRRPLRPGLARLCWASLWQGLPLAAQTSATLQQLESTARERLAAQDVNGALATYEKLAALVPRSAAYQDEIGFLLAATNLSPDAIAHFQRATELDPKMAQAWYHLGVALWLTQHPEPALRALQKAVALEPERTTGQPFRSWRGRAGNYPLTPRSGERWATSINN